MGLDCVVYAVAVRGRVNTQMVAPNQQAENEEYIHLRPRFIDPLSRLRINIKRTNQKHLSCAVRAISSQSESSSLPYERRALTFSRADLEVGYLVSGCGFGYAGMLAEERRNAPETLYEIVEFEARWGEEFARLRPLHLDTDSAEITLRTSEVASSAWEVIRAIRPPSFFQVGFEYQARTAEEPYKEFFRVVAKSAEGLDVVYFGKKGSSTDFVPWEEICILPCEELAPHPPSAGG